MDLQAWTTQYDTIYGKHIAAGHYPADAKLALSYPGNWAGDRLDLGDTEGIEKVLTRKDKAGKDLYFRISPMKNRVYEPKERGGAIDGLGIPCLFSDLDTEDGVHAPFRGALAGYRHPTTAEALAMIQDVMPATLIIQSGGGLHAYWALDDLLRLGVNAAGKLDTNGHQGTLLNNFDAMWMTEANKRGFAMDGGISKDTARVLRVAGSRNFKTDPAKPVKILEINEGLSYGRFFLERKVPAAPKPAPAKKLRSSTPVKIGDRRSSSGFSSKVTAGYVMEGVWGMTSTGSEGESEREWFFPFEEDGGKTRHAKSIIAESSGLEYVVAYDTRLQEEWGVPDFRTALTGWDLMVICFDGDLEMCRAVAKAFPKPSDDLLDALRSANEHRLNAATDLAA